MRGGQKGKLDRSSQHMSWWSSFANSNM